MFVIHVSTFTPIKNKNLIKNINKENHKIWKNISILYYNGTTCQLYPLTPLAKTCEMSGRESKKTSNKLMPRHTLTWAWNDFDTRWMEYSLFLNIMWPHLKGNPKIIILKGGRKNALKKILSQTEIGEDPFFF